MIRRSYRIDGGAESSFQNYINCYLQLGYDVTILCETWSGKLPPGVAVRNFSVFGTRSMRYVLFVHRVQKYLSNNHYTVVQSHEWIPGATIVRLGDGLHSFWLDQLLRSRKALLKNMTRLSPFHWIKCHYETQTLQSPTLKQIIVNSNYVYEQIAKKYTEVLHKASVQRNVIPTTFFKAYISSTSIILKGNPIIAS